MAKRLFLKKYFKKFLKTFKKKQRRYDVFERYYYEVLRQTHFNTTERNYCLLKT